MSRLNPAVYRPDFGEQVPRRTRGDRRAVAKAVEQVETGYANGRKARAELLDVIRRGYKIFYRCPTLRWLAAESGHSMTNVHAHLLILADEGKLVSVRVPGYRPEYVLPEVLEALKSL